MGTLIVIICFLVNSCSKEALKYSSCGSRRVNISAAVGEWLDLKKKG
jgi:hypothetical protein